MLALWVRCRPSSLCCATVTISARLRVQLSIALDSTLGGLLYNGPGYQATFLTAALLLAAVTLATTRPRRPIVG